MDYIAVFFEMLNIKKGFLCNFSKEIHFLVLFYGTFGRMSLYFLVTSIKIA